MSFRKRLMTSCAFLILLTVQVIAQQAEVLLLGDGSTEDSLAVVLAEKGITADKAGLYYTYTGENLNRYKTVVLLNGAFYSNGIADSVQTKLVNFVKSGGSLLVTEWILWGSTKFPILLNAIPAAYSGSWSSGTEKYRLQPDGAGLGFADSLDMPSSGWSFSVTKADTTAAEQAKVVYKGSRSGDAVVFGKAGQGRTAYWNMGGHYGGKAIWTPEIRNLSVKIVSWLISGSVTSIQDQTQHTHTFQLFQNYPNPFNPETRISFFLPKASPLTLEIFDIQGKLVEVLKNGVVSAGEHSINWNANSNPAGIYFARLKTGNQSQTVKLVLLK